MITDEVIYTIFLKIFGVKVFRVWDTIKKTIPVDYEYYVSLVGNHTTNPVYNYVFLFL
jgi:hypothetical protein